jgi:hypothetical protein
MARRRFGLCDAGEADVVYIRAQVGAARGEIRYRQERYHATSLLRANPGSRDSYAGASRMAQNNRLTSLRRMR